MKRLTTINEMGVVVYKQPYRCERCGESFYRLPDLGEGSPTDRLAEYEDLQDMLDNQFNGHVNMATFVNSIIEYDKQFERDEELADAMMITNESVHKYREWKSLEEQGRLLKLPCKVGDTVFVIYYGEILAKIVKGILFRDGNLCGQDRNGCNLGIFGKTIFLSQEEAETALKNM